MKFSESIIFKRMYAKIQKMLIEKLNYEESTTFYAVTNFTVIYFDELEKILEICTRFKIRFFIRDNTIVFQKDVGFIEDKFIQ